MVNNRVLLVGTSFSAIPLLKYLQENNYHVSVCGGLKNDPCHSYADQSFYIDYSNQDALLKLCQQEEFDFLVPTCNDSSYDAASYVATKLNKFYGYDTYATTCTLHTKNGFRTFTLENNFAVPFAIKANSTISSEMFSNYPLLVKPDESSSGKGVTKIFNYSTLYEAIMTAQENSRNGEAIIEEFVEGNLYSHSAFIQDGEILIDFFADEYCSVYSYQVDCSSLTTNLSVEIQNEVRKSIKKLILLLNLSDGLLHTQFIANRQKYWLIETMRRCPGDLYGTLIQKSTGCNYSQYYINSFLNRKNDTKFIESKKFIARHTITVPNKLPFQSFEVNIPSSKGVEIFPLKESGDLLDEAPFDKVGIIFTEFSSFSELNLHTPVMKDFVKVKLIGDDK